MDTSARNIYRILAIITSFFAILWIAFLARRPLIWIGTAFFLAVALNPAVEWFSRHVTKRRRWASIVLTFLCLVAVLVILVASLVPPVVRQSHALIVHIPQYTDNITTSHNWLGRVVRRYDLVARIKSDQAQLVRQITQFSGSFFVVVRDVFSSIVATVTVLALTFFMLLEGPTWLDKLWSKYRSSQRHHHKELVQEMYRSVTGYVNGNVLTSVLASIATAIMLLILGVPYVAPLALFIGVMDLVPLVGATIGSIVVVIVALFQSLAAGLIMLIFFIIFQQVENHITQPLVYGKTVRISPLLVLVSVLIGAALGGLLGALVAIPVAASIQIIIKDYLKTREI